MNESSMSSQVFNSKLLLARISDDTELAKVLIKTFLENSQNYFTEIQQGIDANNFDKIRFCIHTIKGVSLNLCAEKLSDTAVKMDAFAKAQDWDKFNALFSDLKTEYNDLCRYLKNYLDKNN